MQNTNVILVVIYFLVPKALSRIKKLDVRPHE